MCEIKNKIFSCLKLKFYNLSKFNTMLLIVNFVGALLFLGFMLYPHGNKDVNNDWYWNHIFTVLWPLLAILVTALTFVLSIYLSPILKELNDLSIGFNKSIKQNLIKNNSISLNIFQMIVSIFYVAFLALDLFLLSLFLCDKSSITWITILVIAYAVFTLCVWITLIWELILIDYDNYTQDCLLLLPTDYKNQHAYYTVIERQLRKHLANNDIYRFNNDLILLTKFIAKNSEQKSMFGNNIEKFCIKPLFNFDNEAQYLKSISYSYSEASNFSDNLGAPEKDIATFQNFLFSSNSIMIKEFLVNVCRAHTKLDESKQNKLVGYYLWILDNLCVDKDGYVRSFAFDIMHNFKSVKVARKFLLDAMKITLSRGNFYAARGLYRGHLLLLKNKGINDYIELNNDGFNKVAWLFSDLIHLTMINSALADLEPSSSNVISNQIDDFIFHITKNCSENKDIFLEWVIFIYCHNKIVKSKITEKDFILIYPKTSIFDIISGDYTDLLKQVLSDNLKEIQESDTYIYYGSYQFARAIDDRDFWENPLIAKTKYHHILHEILQNGYEL